MPRPGVGATSPRSTTATNAGSAPFAPATIAGRVSRRSPSSFAAPVSPPAPATHRRASAHAAIKRGGEMTGPSFDPEPATVTRAPIARRAVEVASASPASMAEAESATCRPITRASAMRHSRRARETSSGSSRESAAGCSAMALDPGSGVAMVSPAPPRRARKPDTGGVDAFVDGVFVVEDGDADGFDPARGDSRRRIARGAKSASNRARRDSRTSRLFACALLAVVSGAGAHHTASAQAACAANHIAPGRAAAPKPGPPWGTGTSFRLSAAATAAAATRGKNPSSDDARDRVRNGSAAASRLTARIADARGSCSPSSHGSRGSRWSGSECTASDSIDSAADNPSSSPTDIFPPLSSLMTTTRTRGVHDSSDTTAEAAAAAFLRAVAPPWQPPGGAFASANASATDSSTPSSPAMSPRDSSSCAAAASCARNQAVCAIAWMASDPSGRRRSAETTAAMESTDHIVSAASEPTGGGATATNLRRTLAADADTRAGCGGHVNARSAVSAVGCDAIAVAPRGCPATASSAAPASTAEATAASTDSSVVLCAAAAVIMPISASTDTVDAPRGTPPWNDPGPCDVDDALSA